MTKTTQKHTQVLKVGTAKVEVNMTDPTMLEVRAPEGLANTFLAVRIQTGRTLLTVLTKLRLEDTAAVGRVWLPVSLTTNARVVHLEKVDLVNGVSLN